MVQIDEYKPQSRLCVRCVEMRLPGADEHECDDAIATGCAMCTKATTCAGEMARMEACCGWCAWCNGGARDTIMIVGGSMDSCEMRLDSADGGEVAIGWRRWCAVVVMSVRGKKNNKGFNCREPQQKSCCFLEFVCHPYAGAMLFWWRVKKNT